MIEIIISIFAILGALFTLLGSIGILRFPDVYSRLHAAGKASTLGVICIMLATFLFFLLVEGNFVGKILLTIFFVFLTAPVAGLVMARSAYRVGVPLWEKSKQDDLKEALKKKESSN